MGQLGGVEKMILTDKYCIDIITQTSAIKSAISSLEDEMLGSHLAHCLHDEKNKGRLKEMQASAEKAAKPWEEAAERIDSAFADMWSGALTSFASFKKQMESWR